VPRLALPVVGTGAGGISGDKGQLVTLLVGRLLDLADELVVDIVLVAWGQTMYAACQRARMRLRPAVKLEQLIDCRNPDRVEMTVEKLARSSRLNQLVLFVGAGVSMGADLPGWQGLLDELAAGEGIDIERLHLLDVRDQAQVLANRIGHEKFRALLKVRFQTSDYALAHGLLASLDPHEVVTTNYDTLMEQAFGTARRPAILPSTSVPGGRWLLKLHGTVEEEASMVLTRADYLGLPERSQALLGIVQAMLMTRDMLFVGYSLSDDSLHRVVHEVRRARGTTAEGKLGTVLTLFDDPLLEELWGRDLDIVPVAAALTGSTNDMSSGTASRQLDIVLDQIDARAADVTPFLLDDTYDSMLDPTERAVKSSVQALDAALKGSGPVGEQIADMIQRLHPPQVS